MPGYLHVFLVWLCLFGIWATPSSADETLVIGVEDKDWFTHYVWEDETLNGLDPDIIRAVAGKLGYQVVFEPYPWSRVIRMAEDMQLDGVLDLAHIRKREEKLHYVWTPLTTEQTVFWVKKGNKVAFDGKFTPDMRLGLILGANWTDRFERMGTPEVQRYTSFQQAFENLVAGRIDMFASYLAPTQYHARRLGFLDRIEPHPYREPGMPYYIAFSDRPGHERLAERFDEALKEFLSSPEYQTLLKHHGLQWQ